MRELLLPARALAWLALSALLTGCASGGPPPIRLGAACAGCGMSIEDRHFACERKTAGAWRQYDAIECLLREEPPLREVWLADYDRKTLVPADSLWVVRGEFPSPMGGGLAAFRERGTAEHVAVRTRGRVGRLSDFATWVER